MPRLVVLTALLLSAVSISTSTASAQNGRPVGDRLATVCTTGGGEINGPNWAWRSQAPNGGYGCLYRNDPLSPPWGVQSARVQRICTAEGWNYYDFGVDYDNVLGMGEFPGLYLYGYYGWGCVAP